MYCGFFLPVHQHGSVLSFFRGNVINVALNLTLLHLFENTEKKQLQQNVLWHNLGIRYLGMLLQIASFWKGAWIVTTDRCWSFPRIDVNEIYRMCLYILLWYWIFCTIIIYISITINRHGFNKQNKIRVMELLVKCHRSHCYYFLVFGSFFLDMIDIPDLKFVENKFGLFSSILQYSSIICFMFFLRLLYTLYACARVRESEPAILSAHKAKFLP